VGKKINSYKLLSVMYHSRGYIFARICLGKNDHEVFTGSPLYLQEGEFFLDDEFVAADGVFEGDGHLRCSFKNPGNNEAKKLWNLAFCEVRSGVENSYQRTAAWFPLIGNNKRKLLYSHKVLFLAICVAIRLHNFIMNSEQLSYSALESVDNLYTNYY
jgi:hypothetical protein